MMADDFGAKKTRCVIKYSHLLKEQFFYNQKNIKSYISFHIVACGFLK